MIISNTFKMQFQFQTARSSKFHIYIYIYIPVLADGEKGPTFGKYSLIALIHTFPCYEWGQMSCADLILSVRYPESFDSVQS